LFDLPTDRMSPSDTAPPGQLRSRCPCTTDDQDLATASAVGSALRWHPQPAVALRRCLWWCPLYVPNSLPQPLSAVRTQVRAWRDLDASALTAGERAEWLAGLRQVIDAAEGAFTDVLSVFDAHGDGEVLHAARSTSSWLQGALHLAPGDASRRVRVARAVAELGAPLDLMHDGQVTFDQLCAMQSAVRHVPGQQREQAVALLTDLATRVDAGRLRVAGRALRHAVDPDGALDEARDQFERRYLELSPLLDGMTAVDGLLDAEATAVLTEALAPFLVPAGPDDDRTAAQRRADGLVEVAASALRSGELPTLSGAAAEVQITVSLPALLGLPGASPARIPGCPGGDALLTKDAVARLGCDGSLRRVLLDANGVPLDVGRRMRLFTPALRRALALRDGGCRFPGCGRPARYTDAHHVQSWLTGGLTDRANGVLLCRHHHRAVHEDGWQIRAVDQTAGANGELVFAGPREQRMSSPVRGP
jgi:hypothetical protein